MADETGLECEIYGPDWMREKGMGGVLGVAAGSVQEPRFIVLRYNGAGDASPVALVGKGITFDTGGISIKPAAGMGEMKGDMAGGASVIAAMGAIARLKPARQRHRHRAGDREHARRHRDQARRRPRDDDRQDDRGRSTRTPRAASSSPTASPTPSSRAPRRSSTSRR